MKLILISSLFLISNLFAIENMKNEIKKEEKPVDQQCIIYKGKISEYTALIDFFKQEKNIKEVKKSEKTLNYYLNAYEARECDLD